MSNYKLRRIPLSIGEFQLKYSIKGTRLLISEYAKYLDTNSKVHHYQGASKHQWFARQVNQLNLERS